ncbi:hypothetical protein HNP46_007126 [Pseudomonas nitritireducens]|uniref:Uncharacterized protein n=1 Tax=Pseudomonas nitroreducens TaxID=46680 RepID=A0A7W7P513_PSENT|nr:hypothetical protein [Pseudomonas nitritireducens]MBB4868206.1 hypothetical protein [Pseudomonas nitritireducens]
MDRNQLDAFVQRAGAEAGVVDGAAQVLWEYFKLQSHCSWLAVRGQIEEAQAQRHPSLQKREVALRWIEAAKENRLKCRIDPARGIIIWEE